MNKRVSETILQVLVEGAKSTLEVIEAVLESGYGASYRKLDRKAEEIRRRKNREEISRAERQKFYSLISKLSREGFVQKSPRKLGKWGITLTGKNKLKNLKAGGFPVIGYQRQKSDQIVIVTFDVPEKEKNKRQWLRNALSNMGFVLYQRSVWLGKVKIPPEFLYDLQRLKLSSYVGILSVNKSGTLEEFNFD